MLEIVNHPISTFEGKVIRPVPFVSVSSQSLKTKEFTLGQDYTITLTGTILTNRGSPQYATGNSSATFLSSTDSDPDIGATVVDKQDVGRAILMKQNALRELFGYDGIRMKITSFENSAAITLLADVSTESITFDPGSYQNTGTYTIVLKATHLLDANGKILREGLQGNAQEVNSNDPSAFRSSTATTPTTVAQERLEWGGFVEDYNEEWSIETDEGFGETGGPNGDDAFNYIPNTYIVTRTISATGRVVYDGKNSPVKVEAWEEARKFIKKKLLTDTPISYPGYKGDATGYFAHDILNLNLGYNAFDHTRTENINKQAGVVTVTETWVLLKGVAASETYDLSVESSTDSPFVTVNINGTIRGHTSLPATSDFYGGKNPNDTSLANKAENALTKYFQISNDGRYGMGSHIFKRAKASSAINLNPQPISISTSRNDFTGEISYALQFDNRPRNIISEAMKESIQVNDTYPGDIYAVIPVIGRPTGPVLQYIGGRTEYKRDVSIELIFDYTDIDNYTPANYTETNTVTSEEIKNLRAALTMTKPSLVQPVRKQLGTLIKSLSPLSEPNIRKCFLNPPVENWSPREGRYSISLSWVYELKD